MFSTLSLQNFKSFRHLDKLEIRPITILAGRNSCGKSSILQSLLLLKQTVESKNLNQTILLNGKYVHLGVFQNIIHNKDAQLPISLEFSFNIAKEQLPHSIGQFPLYFLLRHVVSEQAYDLAKAQYRFTYHVKIRSLDKKHRSIHIPSILIDQADLAIETLNSDGSVFEATTITVIHDREDHYMVNWHNINGRPFGPMESYSGNGKFQVAFSNLLPVQITSSTEQDSNLWQITSVFNQFSEILKYELSSVTYLGPLREEPARRYIYEDEVLEIGNKGENAAFIFHAEQDSQLSNLYFPNFETGKFTRHDKSLRLIDALQKWNACMDISNVRAEPANEIIQLNLDSRFNSSTRVNIADVGFGISQIFPILLEGLRMNEFGTLILEQPEIHLHPKLQMQMADYFIALALSGKRVIVETHSEHIINRLVRRSIENRTHHYANLMGIYFIEQEEDGSKYSKIRIDPEHGIINWPQGFFDQGANEHLRIMQAALKNREE